MTDEEIFDAWESTGHCIEEKDIIAFARLIAQRQREIDAEICEAEEPWGNDADAWASTCLRRAAKAIRSQK